jgi:4-methyl-5(b-hydroxyethyl)-thiazole monophosphate biosynthesis
MPKALVALAQGCEELEAVTVIDLLRRANIEVVSAGLSPDPVICSRGVVLIADTTLKKAAQMDDFDIVILPGGLPGADNLADSPLLNQVLKKMAAEGKYIAAICAAPRVLAKAGLLEGKRVTAYPGFIEGGNYPGVHYTGGAVEVDGKIVTSRGPGTAMDFALTLIGLLAGETTRNTVEAGLKR